MLDAGRLSLIVRAGAGYNAIDVPGASTRGIYVSNCPGKNAIAVAELAFGLILSIDRRIPDNVAALRAGVWNKKEFSKAQGLYGRTLVLLGAGSIGQEMIRRAAGFGMGVVIWSRRFDGQHRPLTDLEAREMSIDSVLRSIPITLAPTPADAVSRGDVVSVHVALSPQTMGLVNGDLRSRARVRAPAPREPERPGDGEHRLRRGRGGRGAHQPRRRAAGIDLSDDREREHRRSGSSTREALTVNCEL